MFGVALQPELEIEADEVAARDEVRDAGDGFEPYSAVAPSFNISMRSNAIIGSERRVDEVLAAIRRHGALRLAPAVDQHQRRAHAEPAQIHVARARREILRERVRVVLRARVDRRGPRARGPRRWRLWRRGRRP